MALIDLLIDAGSDIYYDPVFRNVLEDHMTYLREHPQTTIMPISPNDAYVYRQDLFGVLLKNNVQPQYHWLVMRMNKYTAPHQFSEDVISLMVPNANVIAQIRSSHMATPRIS